MSRSESSFTLSKITESNLFFPFAALALILLFDLVAVPGFFRISTREGNLYGNLIDIVRNASTVSLLAIGMTLVIATGGVDLSVGAIMAVAASVVTGSFSDVEAMVISSIGDAVGVEDVITLGLF